MKSISMIVPSRPVPKKRPRVTRNGSHTYTPRESTDFAQLVNITALQQRFNEEFPKVMLPHAVEINILFVLKGKTQPVCRPDVNNLAASVLDGLEGAWYEDDCQVVKLHARKMQGAEEGTLIQMVVLEESECQLELVSTTA